MHDEAQQVDRQAADHLCMILDSEADTARFWRLAQDLARAAVPEEILDVIRLGRLTALVGAVDSTSQTIRGHPRHCVWRHRASSRGQDDGPTVGSCC